MNLARCLPVRTRALLSLSVPLAAGGCLLGHVAGYALVGMSRRDSQLHGYLSFAPQFLAIWRLCSPPQSHSGSRAACGAGSPPGRSPSSPPLAFSAQELIQRLVAGLPAHAVLEPPVFVGLAAQLPIALAGFFLARALLRVADVAARALRTLPPPVLAGTLLLASASPAALSSSPFRFDRPARAPPHS